MLFDYCGSPKRPRTALGIGLVGLDLLERRASISEASAGGTCANVLAILSFLGWSALPVSRLSDDYAGQCVRRDLTAWNVGLDLISLEPLARTPVIRHILSPSAGRGSDATHGFSLRCPHCGTWFPTYQPITIAASRAVEPHVKLADVLFIDRASPSALRLAEAAVRAKATVMFEPSARADVDITKAIAQCADVIKYSEAQRESFQLPAFDVPLEIETRGHRGLRFRTRTNRRGYWRTVKAKQVSSVRDAGGAGDWCSAGFLHALVGHMGRKRMFSEASAFRALDFGATLAAWNCMYEGARGAMYSIERVQLEPTIRRLVAGQLVVEPRSPVLTLSDANGARHFCRACFAESEALAT